LLKKYLRALALVIVPSLGSALIRLIYITNKKEFHSPESLGETPFIMACWHGDLLMTPYAYIHYKDDPHAKIIISEHFDGNLIAKVLNKFNFGAIRGSSTRGGVKALIQAIKDLKDGYDLGITPDGPKGPRHEVSDGIVVMSQKAKVDIIFLEIKPTQFWQLNSWDKFVIPKPFGTIHYYISERVNIEGLSMEDAKVLIKNGLLKHEK